jgi:hypothetical protein
MVRVSDVSNRVAGGPSIPAQYLQKIPRIDEFVAISSQLCKVVRHFVAKTRGTIGTEVFSHRRDVACRSAMDPPFILVKASGAA